MALSLNSTLMKRKDCKRITDFRLCLLMRIATNHMRTSVLYAMYGTPGICFIFVVCNPRWVYRSTYDYLFFHLLWKDRVHVEAWARICKHCKEPRNRFPVWRNRFLGSLDVYKFGLCRNPNKKRSNCLPQQKESVAPRKAFRNFSCSK